MELFWTTNKEVCKCIIYQCIGWA